MRSRHVALALTTAAVLLGAPPTAAQVPVRAEAARPDPGLQRLERELARLATIAGGTVGVSVRHLETGREVHLNRGSAFPMASAFKLPVAVQLLTRVDRRELRLDSMITIQPGDLHPGSGTLTELFDDPGVVLSVRNLLELMLLISDNSATDLVLRVAGGPARVTERMRALGVEGVRVDRPTVRLIADWVGVRLATDDVSPDQWRELARATSDSSRRVAGEAFDVDPRDTSTPEGMANLLTKVWRGEALSRESTTLLLDVLRRVSTGADRLKGLLPPGTVVRHKTGTIGGTTNDVGIIELPDGAGNVAIAVYVKGSTKEVPVRERAIAQIARAVYDYFLFNPGPGSGI
jgi:beta-lactamase class A